MLCLWTLCSSMKCHELIHGGSGRSVHIHRLEWLCMFCVFVLTRWWALVFTPRDTQYTVSLPRMCALVRDRGRYVRHCVFYAHSSRAPPCEQTGLMRSSWWWVIMVCLETREDVVGNPLFVKTSDGLIINLAQVKWITRYKSLSPS